MTDRRTCAPLVAVLLLASLATRASAAGTELQVNTYTTGIQTNAVVTVDGAGNFVVVWRSNYSGSSFDDGSADGIFGQRYDNGGLPVGGEFQVNTYTTGFQRTPRVAADAAGNFMVVWTSSTLGVAGRRYDAAGVPLGDEFVVNADTTQAAAGPRIAADGAGNFVVVWVSDTQEADSFGVFGRRFDPMGVPLGGDFQVNTYTTSEQWLPAVDADAAGDFVVVWTSGSGAPSGQDGSYTGVFGRRFDATGTPVGGEFQVNTVTIGRQYLPDVAVDAAGNFVVVWSHIATTSQVSAQRFDAMGVPLGGEFTVNPAMSSIGDPPAVARDGAGNFVVTWESLDGDENGIFAQRFDGAGARVGGEFQMNSYTTDLQFDADVAMNAAGDFVVAWERSRNETLYGDISAQRGKPDRLIRGKQLDLRNPTGSEDARRLNLFARESPTEVGPTVDGDPTVHGATLRVITNGMTPTDQTYVLDASGWQVVRGGFKYLGPTGADGDPVARVILKRITTKVLLRVDVRGSKGTQSVDLVPPNPGADAAAILQIGGDGGIYCASFGGAAGGTERRDLPERWTVVNATAEPVCPTP